MMLTSPGAAGRAGREPRPRQLRHQGFRHPGQPEERSDNLLVNVNVKILDQTPSFILVLVTKYCLAKAQVTMQRE